MKRDEQCVFERDTIRASRSHVWTDELRSHASSCSQCTETMALTTAFTGLAERGVTAQHSLPGHYAIYLKAAFTRRQDSLTTLEHITLLISSVIAAGIFSGLLLWKSPEVISSLQDLSSKLGSAWEQLLPVGLGVSVVMGFIAIALVLLQDYLTDR